MNIVKYILTESRSDNLKKKYSNKFDETILNKILELPFLKKTNHKYTDFFLKVLDSNSPKIEKDIQVIHDAIVSFDDLLQYIEQKDINQYKTLEELQYALIEPKTKQRERELEKKVDKIFENSKFLVVIPKTQEASCKYGANTKWCVTVKDSGEFERHTSGSQVLYFIIDKQNSTRDKYSKIAIHYDTDGDATFFDSKDNILSNQKIKLLKKTYPGLFAAIDSNYESRHSTRMKRYLNSVFNKEGVVKSVHKNFKNSGYTFEIESGKLETIQKFGIARGGSMVYIKKDNEEEIENHLTFDFTVFFHEKEIDSYKISVHFQQDEFSKLSLPSFESELNYKQTLDLTHKDFLTNVNNFIYNQLNNLKNIQKYIKNVTWFVERYYGYTFQENKGLIKKLVDWLDSGKKGSKLDFLVSASKLKRKIVDGTKLYSIPGLRTPKFKPSSDFRGHFSSFFASAKNAGIIDYERVGNKYFIIKGPNFEAFKRGELTAV